MKWKFNITSLICSLLVLNLLVAALYLSLKSSIFNNGLINIQIQYNKKKQFTRSLTVILLRKNFC